MILNLFVCDLIFGNSFGKHLGLIYSRKYNDGTHFLGVAKKRSSRLDPFSNFSVYMNVSTLPLILEKYIRTPRLTLAGAITLSETLLAQDSSQDSELVRSAHTKLRAATTEAQEALITRQEYVSDNQPNRTIDEAADNAWRAMYNGLLAQSRLPEATSSKATSARELIASLFPNGDLSFLRLRYVDQYAVMQATVKRIEEGGYLKDLIELLGMDFWEEILRTLKEYRVMIQGELESFDESDFAEMLRNLRLRISDFALKVAAHVDVDDKASLDAAAQRLAAIHTTRLRARRRRRSAQSPTTPPSEPPTTPSEPPTTPSSEPPTTTPSEPPVPVPDTSAPSSNNKKPNSGSSALTSSEAEMSFEIEPNS